MKHIVVCATVPICFPKLPLSELTLTALEDLPFIKGALQKTGLAAGIVDKYAPCLFSGLQETFSRSVCERKGHIKQYMLETLQEYSAAVSC